MKRLTFLLLSLCIGINIANAQQDVIDKATSEIKPLLENANKIWHDGNTRYGMTSERAERYAFYTLKACDIIDKYKSQITDIDEKLAMMWGQIDILSELLLIYEEWGYGLSQAESATQMARKVATLNEMRFIAVKITDKYSQNTEIYNIAMELGEYYFNQKDYIEAKYWYSMSVSAHNESASTNDMKIYNTDDEIKEQGQRVYYWLGYTAFKLGETALAQNYYDKAKAILNDDLIQPYK